MSSIYYDNYLDRQVKSGINKRIHHLYRKLAHHGLDRKLDILEIGCGIGALTYLLSRRIKDGHIEAIDFSQQSVDFAVKHIDNSKIHFSCSDVLGYKPAISQFDYILLFDVLEHIPEEKHEELFRKIFNWMHNDSFLFINLPNPEYILYDQKNNPDVLQEVDQPVYLHELAPLLNKQRLHIWNMETYSIWVRNDYQFYVVQKQKAFEEIVLNDQMNIVEKAIERVRLKFRKLRYNYPR